MNVAEPRVFATHVMLHTLISRQHLGRVRGPITTIDGVPPRLPHGRRGSDSLVDAEGEAASGSTSHDVIGSVSLSLSATPPPR